MKSAKTLYEEAMKCFAKERIEEALKLLEEAVRLDDRYPDALEALGVLYQRAGSLEQAVAIFKKLSKADPDSIMAHTNLSRIYVGQGKISEAEAEQAEARRLTWKQELKDRKASQPVFSIEERIERYKKVVELDPHDVLGYFSLGSAYADGKRWAEAVEVFKKALEVDSEHSSSYLGLGQAFQEQGALDEASFIFLKGMPIAERKGDMIPFKKMAARLREIQEKKQGTS